MVFFLKASAAGIMTGSCLLRWFHISHGDFNIEALHRPSCLWGRNSSNPDFSSEEAKPWRD